MGKKNHLSRLASPKAWPVKRKGLKWIAKPVAGAHNLKTSMPLVVILREILGVVETAKEVKRMIQERELLVNNNVPKNIKLPVGFQDVISIPKLKLAYRMMYSQNGKLIPAEIKAGEANLLPLKVGSKTSIKGGKTQLNFSNGWNLLVSKDTYKINDVVVIDLATKKIKNHLKFGPGKEMYIVAGKRLGSTGKLKDVKKIGVLKKENIATLESKSGTWETKAEYLFVKA